MNWPMSRNGGSVMGKIAWVALLMLAASTVTAQRVKVEERVGELRFEVSDAQAESARLLISDGATTRTGAWQPLRSDGPTTWTFSCLGARSSQWRVWLETPNGRQLAHDGVRTVDAIELITPDPERVVQAARQALAQNADAWLAGLRRVAVVMYNTRMDEEKAAIRQRAESEQRQMDARKIDLRTIDAGADER